MISSASTDVSQTAAVYDYIYEYLFAGKATYKETSEARFRDLDPITGSLITHYRLDGTHDTASRAA